MEEEDDDIVQEMERHLNCSQQVYPVKEKYKMSIIENENASPMKEQLSTTLENNLKSLLSPDRG